MAKDQSKAGIIKELIPKKTVRLEALSRFNFHKPGEIFEAEAADAAKWIKNGIAREAATDAKDDEKTAA